MSHRRITLSVGTKATRSTGLLSYCVALLSVALAVGISLLLESLIRPTPNSLFFIAVMLGAWYGGLGPGLVATIFSTLAINYYFVLPYYSLKIAEPGSLLRLGVFVIAAVLISGLNEARWIAIHREQKLRAASEAAQGEAQAAKERLETVLYSINDGFYVLDPNWRFTYVNNRYCQIARMRREELLGQNIWDVFPDTVGTDFYLKLQQVMTEGTPVQFEYFYFPWHRWFEYWVYPSPDGITVFIAEITDHKQIEAALRQSETILNAFIASSPIGMAFFDRDLRYVYANDALAAINGIPLSQHLGRTLEEVLPQWAPTIKPILQQVIQTKTPLLNQEVVGTTNPADLVRHCLVNYFPVCLPDGAVIGVGVTGMDISERRQAEAALRRSEERLRISQELSLDAFTILDSVRDATGAIVDFVWIYVNPKAAEILQHPVEKLVGQRLLEVLPGNQLNSELFARYVGVVETGEPQDSELFYNVDGITGWFRNMAVKLEDGVAIFFSDITQRKCRERNAEFLADISQDLTRAISINEIFENIGGKICRYFDFSILTFSLINDTAERAKVIYNNHKPDVKDALGEHRLADYLSNSQIEQLRAGEMVAIEDVSALEIEGVDAAYQPFQVRSTLIAPYVSNRQLKFILAGNRNRKSRWRTDEIELVQELAARIWIRMERARAEENLRRSEEEFRTISNAAPALVWVSSPKGEIIFFNDRWYEFTGQTEAEAVGHGWAETMHPDDAVRILPYWERCQ
ncbi:MAG TPA: hypothetical protein DC064_06615, partial [Cyanobacteria bacterium UBA9273]|nr:hypothetical protein [Cyanobacteria bacterium UBA9273]